MGELRRYIVAPKNNRLTNALLETANDMREGGLLKQEAYNKITMRHLSADKTPKVATLSGEEIRNLRERSHMSQAVFATYLNLTVGYISQLERGAKRPTGPALVLLNFIQRKGIEALL
jgi:putative transcriptional regulator